MSADSCHCCCCRLQVLSARQAEESAAVHSGRTMVAGERVPRPWPSAAPSGANACSQRTLAAAQRRVSWLGSRVAGGRQSLCRRHRRRHHRQVTDEGDGGGGDRQMTAPSGLDCRCSPDHCCLRCSQSWAVGKCARESGASCQWPLTLSTQRGASLAAVSCFGGGGSDASDGDGDGQSELKRKALKDRCCRQRHLKRRRRLKGVVRADCVGDD